MLIIPAIDLKDGQCVRLLKGEFDTVHKVAESAVDTARSFLNAGAKLLHMVDLDGALKGEGKNRQVVKEVIDQVGIPVELGGGIRTMEDIETVLSLGVSRVIIGSAAVENPSLVEDAVKKFGDKIAVGIDAKDGEVKTRGWIEGSGIDYIEFSKKMESFGVKTIIFTDIDSDGTLAGPCMPRLLALRAAVSCEIVASGGVTTMEDLKALNEGKIDAAILGKTLYSGKIDLKKACETYN